MKKTKVHDIKREKKKSLFFREMSSLVQSISQDELAVAGVYVTRVELSADTGICFVYLSTFKEKEYFDKALDILKLYKPSMRSELSNRICSRYTPNIVFKYDEAKEKERHMHDILDKIKEDD